MSRVGRQYSVEEATSLVKERSMAEKGTIAGLFAASKIPHHRELSLSYSMPRSIDEGATLHRHAVPPQKHCDSNQVQ